MKNIYVACIAVFSGIILAGCSGKVSDPATDKKLYSLLDGADYFSLREQLTQDEGKLSKDRSLYYNAYCNHVFDRCELSNEQIKTLFDKYGKSLHDSVKNELLELQAQNYVRMYRYADAADALTRKIEYYLEVMDSTDLDDTNNSLLLYNALADAAPQVVHRDRDIEIASFRDEYNYLKVPVSCGGVEQSMIFDTGANLSTIIESLAEKMGLTIYDIAIDVDTSTGVKVKTRLAVADSLLVGDLLFENVVFLVLPDEMFYFQPIDYQIYGVIGFPVMYQMEEVHMHKDGTMFIPSAGTDRGLKNLALEELSPVVRLYSGADTLRMTFDSGAATTHLSKKYYDEHRQQVEQLGQIREAMRGGAGGIVTVQEYELTNFPYRIGSKADTLPQIKVSLDEYEFNKAYDGNLGQDIITRFDNMVLNFKYMYIDFE